MQKPMEDFYEMCNSKSKIFYFLFVICHLALVIHLSSSIGHLAFAQEATPSSEEKARQILEAVRERIKAGQVASQRRAFVGELKSISNSTLVLTTDQGVRQVKVASEAAIVRIPAKGGRQEIKFEDLALEEYTIAMGYLGGNQVLDGKRIVAVEKPQIPPRREAVLGTIEEIDPSEKTITLSPSGNGQSFTFTLQKAAKLTAKLEKELKEIELEDLKIGDKIVVAIVYKSEDTLQSRRLHLLTP